MSSRILVYGGFLGEIGIFVDESGGQGGRSKYYVLTLVFHDQGKDIAPELKKYREGLAMRKLKELPFHAGPLMNGHDEYGGMDFSTRKSYFALFFLCFSIFRFFTMHLCTDGVKWALSKILLPE